MAAVMKNRAGPAGRHGAVLVRIDYYYKPNQSKSNR
jgi:hypothetical protein